MGIRKSVDPKKAEETGQYKFVEPESSNPLRRSPDGTTYADRKSKWERERQTRRRSWVAGKMAADRKKAREAKLVAEARAEYRAKNKTN